VQAFGALYFYYIFKAREVSCLVEDWKMTILSVVILLGSLMMGFNPSAGLAFDPGAIEFGAIKPDEQCCPALDNQCANNPKKKKAVCNLGDSQFKRCVKSCDTGGGGGEGDKPCVPECLQQGFTREQCDQQCSTPPGL
jgi:hypothetical protein